MDGAYLREEDNPKIPRGFVIIIIMIILLAGGLYFLLKGNKKLVSPVPPKPSFEVVFYTPTPLPASPTSTPSATPKLKKTPAPSPKATKAPTASPGETTASPSPTVKPT